MSLEVIVIAPTIIVFVVGVIAYLCSDGYSFDLRKRNDPVRVDRRKPPIDEPEL